MLIAGLLTGVVVRPWTFGPRRKLNRLAAWATVPNCQRPVVIMSRIEARVTTVGIENLLVADMPARTSFTTFAVAGVTISSSETPLAARVAARVVEASSSLETAATAGLANTAVISAAERARPRRAKRERSNSRARERRREIDPSGQPSCAAAWALVFPSR